MQKSRSRTELKPKQVFDGVWQKSQQSWEKSKRQYILFIATIIVSESKHIK